MELSDAQRQANSRLTFLDLCCGLKGASQPAIDRGWKVITVDIDPRFKPTIVADVRALPLKPFHVDVLWASPPCQEFSRLGLPWFLNKGPLPNPDLSLVEGVQRAVEQLSPSWWIVENVRNSRKWISPILGAVRYCSTGHYLWGRLPGLIPNVSSAKGSWGHRNGSGKWREEWHPNKESLWPTKDRPALRAKIPYEIGAAICAAVERRRRETLDTIGHEETN